MHNEGNNFTFRANATHVWMRNRRFFLKRSFCVSFCFGLIFFLFYPVALRLYIEWIRCTLSGNFFFFSLFTFGAKNTKTEKKKVAVKRTFCRPARHPKITKSSVGSKKRITMLCFEYKCLCDFFFFLVFPQQDVIDIGRKKNARNGIYHTFGHS